MVTVRAALDNLGKHARGGGKVAVAGVAAVTVCRPGLKPQAVKLASPVADSTPEPTARHPLVQAKVTVPVGPRLPGAGGPALGTTTTVKLTGWP